MICASTRVLRIERTPARYNPAIRVLSAWPAIWKAIEPVSFLSCTFDDGVFALKLDFSFGRRKAPKPKPSAPRASAPRPTPSGKKKGAKPLPPPFALPPVRRSHTPIPDLLASLPPPPVPDLHLDEPAMVPGGPNDPTYPSVILDTSFARGPGATVLMDDEDDSPLDNNKTDLVKQRRDVRKALRRG